MIYVGKEYDLEVCVRSSGIDIDFDGKLTQTTQGIFSGFFDIQHKEQKEKHLILGKIFPKYEKITLFQSAYSNVRKMEFVYFLNRSDEESIASNMEVYIGRRYAFPRNYDIATLNIESLADTLEKQYTNEDLSYMGAVLVLKPQSISS